jgi:hypothetical protein
VSWFKLFVIALQLSAMPALAQQKPPLSPGKAEMARWGELLAQGKIDEAVNMITADPSFEDENTKQVRTASRGDFVEWLGFCRKGLYIMDMAPLPGGVETTVYHLKCESFDKSKRVPGEYPEKIGFFMESSGSGIRIWRERDAK